MKLCTVIDYYIISIIQQLKFISSHCSMVCSYCSIVCLITKWVKNGWNVKFFIRRVGKFQRNICLYALVSNSFDAWTVLYAGLIFMEKIWKKFEPKIWPHFTAFPEGKDTFKILICHQTSLAFVQKWLKFREKFPFFLELSGENLRGEHNDLLWCF